MNALEWNRDLSRPLEEIRAREAHLTDRPDRGRGTVSFAEMRRGGIGLCVGTQIARYVHRSNPLPGWHSAEQAWAMTQGQLAWYREMEARGEIVDRHDARRPRSTPRSLGRRPRPGHAPIGMIRSLEGADSIVTLAHLERAWRGRPARRRSGALRARHVRAGHGRDRRHRHGGRELLVEMDAPRHDPRRDAPVRRQLLGSDGRVHGPVWASHSNCRALVPHNRQFSDEQITHLVGRGAVIGAALDAWMLVPGWDPRQDDARRDRRDARHRRRSHRSRLPDRRQRAATPASAAISTARSAPSRPPSTWTRSPTSRRFPICSARAATAPPTSTPSPAATSSGSSGERGRTEGLRQGSVSSSIPARSSARRTGSVGFLTLIDPPRAVNSAFSFSRSRKPGLLR